MSFRARGQNTKTSDAIVESLGRRKRSGSREDSTLLSMGQLTAVGVDELAIQ